MKRVSIIGGSGYTGGEFDPLVELSPRGGSSAGDFACTFGRVYPPDTPEHAQDQPIEIQ